MSWAGGFAANFQKKFREGRERMFLAIAIILAIIWIILFLALHITAGLIHIIIALAVISLIVHLFTGRKRV